MKPYMIQDGMSGTHRTSGSPNAADALVSSPQSSEFEKTLAFHCAPVLLGIKSANLVSFPKQKHPFLWEELYKYHQALSGRDLHFECLCECGRRVLILVYRGESLNGELSAPEAVSLLQRFGYSAGSSLPRQLERLKERIGSCGDFPHEIGLFLGYPPSDVLGFIENQGRDCLLSGYWKVYSNAEQCKKLFDRYTACRTFLCGRISKGDRLISLLRAA